MGVYLPATHISTKALGNGSANIATWRFQNTAGAGNNAIVRLAIFDTPTAASTVTVQQGATAADTTAQRLLDAQPLTVNTPYKLEGWIVIINNDYFQGFANNATTNGAAYGYTFTP